MAEVTTRDPAGAGGVATHCPYCALQCGMTLRSRADGEVEVAPRDFPTNRGGLCQKGWTAAALLDHPGRLTTPLVRDSKGGPLRPAGWDEALTRIVDGIGALRAAHGPDSVAVFGGGGLTNEKAYALGKFARAVLGTRYIDYNGRFCMSSAAAAGIRAFGVDRGLPFPLADLAEADVLLLAGANPAETMPPLVRYLTDQRERGGQLIVVDPRSTPTARHASLHLAAMPGTDLALANALLHVAIVEGLVDRGYVDARTTGFDRVARVATGYWPERVERLTGVGAADLRAAARALAGARRAIIVTARGAEQHSKGTDTVSAWINLALALGLPGRPGSGFGCLTGQGNGQGGREHGQKADQLPGYRRIDDPRARAHVAAVWGVDPADLPAAGVSAVELLDRLGTPHGPGALLVFGANPVVSAPRARRVERRLAALDLLVVADFVRSETAELADVVLPTAQWAEEDGTMTNLEGRVLRRRALRQPPPGVRTDLAILADLAARLAAGSPATGGLPAGGAQAGGVAAGGVPAGGVAAGGVQAGGVAVGGVAAGGVAAGGVPGRAAARGTVTVPGTPAEAFAELRRASAGGPADYAGIDWERIDASDGLFWPCPRPDHPGTPRLFTERFATPDGRARFVPVEHRPPAEPPDEAYPFLLTTGRVLAQYQSGAQTRRVAALNRAAPGAFVEVHPDPAALLSIADGDPVRVVTRRGVIEVPARVVDTIRPDTLFVPFHWPGAERANSATVDALDPTSGMPEFKACGARLERAA